MLLQTNSYIVPKEKKAEHARLLRRFRQTLAKLGCDHFEVYEQVSSNWTADAGGRFVQIMRFRDRRHQQQIQAAERIDASAQALIEEFCQLINFPYQQQQGLFAVGFYTSVIPIAPLREISAAERESAIAGDEDELRAVPPLVSVPAAAAPVVATPVAAAAIAAPFVAAQVVEPPAAPAQDVSQPGSTDPASFEDLVGELLAAETAPQALDKAEIFESTLISSTEPAPAEAEPSSLEAVGELDELLADEPTDPSEAATGDLLSEKLDGEDELADELTGEQTGEQLSELSGEQTDELSRDPSGEFNFDELELELLSGSTGTAEQSPATELPGAGQTPSVSAAPVLTAPVLSAPGLTPAEPGGIEIDLAPPGPSEHVAPVTEAPIAEAAHSAPAAHAPPVPVSLVQDPYETDVLSEEDVLPAFDELEAMDPLEAPLHLPATHAPGEAEVKVASPLASALTAEDEVMLDSILDEELRAASSPPAPIAPGVFSSGPIPATPGKMEEPISHLPADSAATPELSDDSVADDESGDDELRVDFGALEGAELDADSLDEASLGEGLGAEIPVRQASSGPSHAPPVPIDALNLEGLELSPQPESGRAEQPDLGLAAASESRSGPMSEGELSGRADLADLDLAELNLDADSAGPGGLLDDDAALELLGKPDALSGADALLVDVNDILADGAEPPSPPSAGSKKPAPATHDATEPIKHEAPIHGAGASNFPPAPGSSLMDDDAALDALADAGPIDPGFGSVLDAAADPSPEDTGWTKALEETSPKPHHKRR